MSTCYNCGTTLNDGVAFCPNCGTNQPPTQPTSVQAPGQASAPAFTFTPQPVSVGGWIGRSLIPYIPLVGGLVYLIMLFIWCGDKSKEETFRNWAKAQLIVMAISIGISLIMVIGYFLLIGILFGGAAASVSSIEYARILF